MLGMKEAFDPNHVDTDHTDYPVCPHCGHVHEEWECRGEGEEEDTPCDACESLMDVSTHISISYSTTKAPDRCAVCKGEKDRPGHIGVVDAKADDFRPVYCSADFHEGAVR